MAVVQADTSLTIKYKRRTDDLHSNLNFLHVLTAVAGMAGCNFVLMELFKKDLPFFFFNALMPLVFISALIGILKWL